MHLIGSYQQGSASLGELVGDIHLLQRCNNGSAIAIGQIAVQHTVVRRLSPHPGSGYECEQCRNTHPHPHLLLEGELVQQIYCLLFLFSHSDLEPYLKATCTLDILTAAEMPLKT